MGADVIKIEKPGGDPARNIGPFYHDEVDPKKSLYWFAYNTSKRGVTLDIETIDGQELFKKLVKPADFVIESFSPGYMDKLGLGYSALEKLNPAIIMVSITPFGQTGPYAAFDGDGNVLTALSGFTHITGWSEREALAIGPYTDYIGPHYSITAILAALDYRQRTGKGLRIDLSQYETGVHFMVPLVLDWNVNKRVANRMGNSSTYAAPHGAYKCLGEDRWCATAVFTDKEWESFCQVIGNPAWTMATRFSTLEARMRNIAELDRLIDAWSINHSAEDVMTMMQAAGVAAGTVQNAEDLEKNDPQLKHRKYFWGLDHAVLGMYRNGRAPFILSKASCSLQPALLLGEHNEYVCKEILKMSDEEIAELVMEGVIE